MMEMITEEREPVLTAAHLKKTFILSRQQMKIDKTTDKHKVAVNDLSFVAYPGEIFGLLGPNGAGKTTTLRMLSTLIKPDEGDAVILGQSILQNPDAVRQQIGFLSGELKLEDYFTPSYLFDYFAVLHGMDRDTIAARKKDLFEKFGIDKYAEVKYGDLSTGMKQKTALVISIVHDPAIVIFDEPTNGLDIIAAKAVTDFLLELKRAGKTVILSTHIFSLVEQLCDRVGIIIGGRMVLEGNLNDLTREQSIGDVFFAVYDKETGNGGEVRA